MPATPSRSSTQPEQLLLPMGPARDLPETFRKVFRRLAIAARPPSFDVEYRPFAGLRSTICLRKNQADVRISDVLEGAPPLVLEALAEILIAQVFRRPPSREARECYLAYVFKPNMRRRIEDSRRRRSSKRLLPAQGRCYDLGEIFQRLNRKFFRGQLAQPRLGWSPRRSRTILGHYDSAHGAIIINPLLDSPAMPRYLVEYLVFHEMLHIRYPVERRGHLRVVHSREFRRAEKEFPQYEQARRKLKQFCA